MYIFLICYGNCVKHMSIKYCRSKNFDINTLTHVDIKYCTRTWNTFFFLSPIFITKLKHSQHSKFCISICRRRLYFTRLFAFFKIWALEFLFSLYKYFGYTHVWIRSFYKNLNKPVFIFEINLLSGGKTKTIFRFYKISRKLLVLHSYNKCSLRRIS